jgi:transposase
MDIMDAVGSKHASEEVKWHALYMFFFCGLNKAMVAKYLHKAESTVGAWVKKYEEGGGVSRADKEKV